jgi:hypothetical protein
MPGGKMLVIVEGEGINERGEILQYRKGQIYEL